MDYVAMNASVDIDLDEAIAEEVGRYLVDTQLAIVLGPIGTIRHAGEIAGKPDLSVAGRAVAVELGAMGTMYAYLQLLNYVQGPKYAMDFWTLHQSINPARNMAIRAGGPVAIMAAAQVELSKTKVSNLGMEPIPGVEGAYSNPMGGSSGNDFYYPGKGLVDWFKGLW